MERGSKGELLKNVRSKYPAVFIKKNIFTALTSTKKCVPIQIQHQTGCSRNGFKLRIFDDHRKETWESLTEKGPFSFQSQRKAMPKNALISHTSKLMLKILQTRLQQYVNRELPDAQAGFRKGRGTRDQIANICWIIKKAREFQKYIYFCFTDYSKAFDCVDHNKLWKILKEMGIPDHLTRLLRNLYAGQEATIRTGHGSTHWFQIRKEVRQGCIGDSDGNPLQYPCLENPMNGGAWLACSPWGI